MMLSKEQLQAIRERVEKPMPGLALAQRTALMCEDIHVLLNEVERLDEKVEVFGKVIDSQEDEIERLEQKNQRLRGVLEKIENLARHHTDNPDWLRKEIVVRVRQALKGGDSE